MAYETKPNTGALFRNDKEGNDKRPDYRGDCVVEGVAYKISAWINEAKSGAKYMSLKFEPKDAAAEAPKPQGAAPRKATPDLSDDIPFLMDR